MSSVVTVTETATTVEVDVTEAVVTVGVPSTVPHVNTTLRDAADSHPQSAITGLTAALALKAALASPAFTGTPTAPTAAADTNTTQIATTAFAKTEADAAQAAAIAASDPAGSAAAAQAAAVQRANHTGTQLAATISDFNTSVNAVLSGSYQPLDSTLTALAGLNATGGIITQTAADTFTKRTLTGTANEITVTYGDGAAGAPTFSLPTALTFTGKTVTGGTISGATVTGGTIDNAPIGGTTPAAVAATTVAASGQITSTVTTGTAPLVVASTTVVANLNSSLLLGKTWAAPDSIGSGTPAAGAFTTIAASGAITSTLATGSAPLVVASTTAVANLNASLLLGQTWANPGAIGGTTPAAISCTTLDSTTRMKCVTAGSAYVTVESISGIDCTLAMSNAAGNYRGIGFLTGTSRRFLWYCTDEAESGANAGSAMELWAYADDNSAIDQPLRVVRAAGGAITLARVTTISGSAAGAASAGTTNIGGGAIQTAGAITAGAGVTCTTLTASGTVKIAGNAASAFLGMATNVDAMRINAGNALNEGGQVILYGSAFGSGYDNNGALYAGSTLVARWKPDQSFAVSGAVTCTTLTATGTGGVGYATGAGGAVTQGTSRATGVTLNKICGAITLYSAAGSATAFSFTVTNSTVAATDIVHVCQKSGTDKYITIVTAVGAGSFEITAYTTGGTTTEQPVFNFAVIKAVAA